MATLSARQQNAAKLAAQRNQLDATGTVQRNGTPTRTPTGTSKGMSTVYDGLPCKLGPYRADGPTATDNSGALEIDERAIFLFPIEWSADPGNVAPSAVVIERGDKITVDGVDWFATTGNQQPATGFQALRRVQVSRSIEDVRP